MAGGKKGAGFGMDIEKKSDLQNKFTIVEGNYAEIGVSKIDDIIYFTFEGEKECSCAILLYEHGGDTLRIPVPDEYCIGALRSVGIRGLDWKNYDYNYEIDGEIMFDPHAHKVIGREKWADFSRKEKEYKICAGFDFAEFDWKNDRFPEIHRENMVMYKLNVRSFTMDGGTLVKKKGTFAGIMERIPYLKQLGVTSLELMPIYEFEELMYLDMGRQDGHGWSENAKEGLKLQEEMRRPKVNCWGYVAGEYYAPKASYAAAKDASVELKTLIRTLHENGMECILEMFFDEKMNQNIAVEILRYWVKEYHVDGFQLLGKALPLNAMGQDLILRRTKLIANGFDQRLFAGHTSYPHLFVYNEDFLFASRKLLSRSDGNVNELLNQLRRQNEVFGFINFITNHNGFTLADLFTYERKHNEMNGEDNRDGMDWNYSSNGGIEGPTRKKLITEYRKKQMRNAMTLVLLGQSVPMILAGDEFGNTQKGNNNCYCQDNKYGWINWRSLKTNHAHWEYVKNLIAFRKEHPIISSNEPMQLNDYQTKGYPDLSYHGEYAWVSSKNQQPHAVGILYCGEYAKKEDGEPDDYIFVGLNFYPGPQYLALPRLPRKNRWYLMVDTADRERPFKTQPLLMDQKNQIPLPPQSIVILVGK